MLEEAQDPSVPLLERVKFLASFSSNLDEFFMVRVAMLKRRIHAGDQTASPDGLTPASTLAAVSERVHELVVAQHRCFLDDIEPLLAVEGILLRRQKEINEEPRRTQLFNLLTGYTHPNDFHDLLVAPRGLRDGLIERIRREVDHARAGRPARILAKMNGLVDRRLIEELYAASAAGVRIDRHLLSAAGGGGGSRRTSSRKHDTSSGTAARCGSGRAARPSALKIGSTRQPARPRASRSRREELGHVFSLLANP